MSQTFGKVIRQARRDKGYSQRDLAKLVDVDYTYLSKLENNHAAYPPSEEVIKLLVLTLDLTEREEDLMYLAGRITADDEKIFGELLKTYNKQVPALLRRMQENPDFAQKLLRDATQSDQQEKPN
ncbi:MAG: helix-turn-helix domain-containing protein [Nostoc sp. LLA-1]|nr:helix-turn-helix domain-containing protein [Cyanocohniella sp. LLY]